MTPLPDVVTFTTNAGDHGSLALTHDWEADVASAVEEDHGCNDRGCDIREALEHGFPLSAAYLLNGATETPALDAVRAAYTAANAIPEGEDFGWTFSAAEWDEWTAWHTAHGRTCEACRSVTYATSTWEPETCSNCGASLTHDYVVAVVYHVRALTAEVAQEKLADGEHDDALFGSGAMRVEELDITDPDFDVTVRSHGRVLERESE